MSKEIEDNEDGREDSSGSVRFEKEIADLAFRLNEFLKKLGHSPSETQFRQLLEEYPDLKKILSEPSIEAQMKLEKVLKYMPNLDKLQNLKKSLGHLPQLRNLNTVRVLELNVNVSLKPRPQPGGYRKEKDKTPYFNPKPKPPGSIDR